MKKWQILLATTMALLLLAIAPVSALAQGNQETNVTQTRPVKDTLAIVAPPAVPVGVQISMSVFQCSDQKPMEGATIWAVTRDKVETLKNEMAARKGEAADEDYDALLGAHGIRLGQTDQTGKLWYTFKDAGRYLLVAVKRGYNPGFRPIAVGVARKALTIDAPKRAEVGEKVTITVFQRGTEDPVKDAGVWAVTREKAESLKNEVAAIRNSGDQAAMEAAAEKSLNAYGIFLGNTNGAGKVQHAFDKAGGYLLVTFKRGYLPGYRPIVIGTVPKALAIDAPKQAGVGEKITITVFQKGTQDPVKDAGVWAITRDKAQSLQNEIAAIRKSGDQTAMEAAVEKALNAYCIFLGNTNGAGKVQHAFDKAGGYLLVTFKRGYFPGYRPIVIGSLAPTPASTAVTPMPRIQK